MKHPIFWFWALYLTGQFLSTFLRAAAVVNSKLSGINTYGHFLRVHAPLIAGRLFFATMGLLVLQSDPDLFWTLLNKVPGVDVGKVPIVNPVVAAAIAGIYGFTADCLLDRLSALIPSLRREVPPASGGTNG